MCSVFVLLFLLIVLIIRLRLVVMIFLMVIWLVRILIMDRLNSVIMRSLGVWNLSIIGWVIRIKMVRKVVLISFLNRDDENVVERVCVVWFFLVSGKLFRIVVCEVEELGIFIRIEVKVFDVGMIVIMLIINVRLRIGFILKMNGSSRDRFVMLLSFGKMLIYSFMIIFKIR